MKTKIAISDSRKRDDDAALLAAARSAQHEGDSFTEIYQSVAAANGLLSVLGAALDGNGNGPSDHVDWVSVGGLIAQCRERNYVAEAALYELQKYEKQANEPNVVAGAR